MSSLICRVEVIETVKNLENSDRLSVVTMKDLDWNVITGKNKDGSHRLKPGMFVCYLPVDSCLDEKFINFFFKDSKIKPDSPTKHRVRSIKIRGSLSQGIILPLDDELITLYPALAKAGLGDDVSKMLNITKYEPPEPVYSQGTQDVIKNRKSHPLFDKYSDIENFKNFPKCFTEEDRVVVTVKVHGCLEARTKITLSDGSKVSIKEIVDSDKEFEVLGMTEDGRVVPTKVINKFNNGYSKDWMTLEFEKLDHVDALNKNWSIKCTPNHKFYINGEYVEASNLKIGDNLTSHIHDLIPNAIQWQILYGLMLGDGSFDKGHKKLSFSHKEDHFEYLMYLNDALGKDLCYLDKTHYTSGYGTCMRRCMTRSNQNVYDKFITWKRLDPELPKYIEPLALAIWYMDDGSLSHHESQKDRANFAICRYTSEEDLKTIESIFLKFGITPTMFKDSKGYNRLRLNTNEAYKMFDLIHKFIPPCMRYKLPKEMRDLPTELVQPQEMLLSQKVYNLKVINKYDGMRHRGNKQKYDIETETHNFFANNVLVHNSSFRATVVPIIADDFPKVELSKAFFSKALAWAKAKISPLIGKTHEFIVGSRNIQFNVFNTKHTYYKGDNLWIHVAKKYNLEKRLRECIGKNGVNSIAVYGEVIGRTPSGAFIQKNYDYGYKEPTLHLYDVKINGKYLDYEDFKQWCWEHNFITVVELYVGPFNKELMIEYAAGKDPRNIDNNVPCREGVVISKLKGTTTAGRKLKLINPEYLLDSNNTDFH